MQVNTQSRILRMVLVVAIAITPHSNALKPWMDHLGSRIERASSELLAPFQPNSSFGIFSSRVKRSPNDKAFNNLQSRISTLARLVTGVSLYNGLVGGSIPVDNAIAELMNAGSISFQDLENFDKAKVSAFVKDATDISGKLKPETARFEKALEDLIKVNEMWNFGGEMSKIPDATKFAGLKLMETIDLKAIEQFDLDDTYNKLSANSASDIPNIQTKLAGVAAASKNAMTSMKEKNILTTLNELAPFHNFAQLMDRYENSDARAFKPESTNQANVIQSNVKSLGGFTIDSSNSLFTVLKAISSSRSLTTSIDRVYTSGLVNGYLDLGQLPKDAENPWILNQYSWLKLKDGLTTISSLESKMKDLNSQWSVLDKESIHRAIKEADYIESNAKGIKDRVGSLDSVIKKINAINSPSAEFEFTKNMMSRSQKLRELHRKAEAVSEVADVCEKFSDSITALDSANSDSIQNALKLLDSLRPRVTGLKSGRKVNEIAPEIVKDSDKYTQINQDASVISHTTFFNELKKTTQELSEAASVSELVTRLRNLKNIKDFSKGITDASTTASASLASIQALRTSMGDIKNLPSADANMFSRLNDLQKFSKQLGDSAAVIAKVQKTLELKPELLNFIHNGHVVDEAGTITDSAGILKTIREHWLRFNDVSVKINKILNVAQNWKDSVVMPQEDKFESYGPILESLVGLEDVDLDVESRLVAVETLAGKATDTAVKAKLESLRKSLVALAPLDLTFAQYSVAGMTGVLTGISKVFSGTAPTSTMKPVPKPVVDVDKNSTVLSLDMEETTEKPEFVMPLWGWVIVGCGIVSGVAIVGGYFYKRSRKPEPTIPDDESESNSGDGKGSKSTNTKTKTGKQKSKSKEGSKKTAGTKSSVDSGTKSKISSATNDSNAPKLATGSKTSTGSTTSTASKDSKTSKLSTGSNDSNNPKLATGSNTSTGSKDSNIAKLSTGSNDSNASKLPTGSKTSTASKDSNTSNAKTASSASTQAQGSKAGPSTSKPDEKKGSKEPKSKHAKRGNAKKNGKGKAKKESNREHKVVNESELRENVPFSEADIARSEAAPGSSIGSERGPSQPPKIEKKKSTTSKEDDTSRDTKSIKKKMKN